MENTVIFIYHRTIWTQFIYRGIYRTQLYHYIARGSHRTCIKQSLVLASGCQFVTLNTLIPCSHSSSFAERTLSEREQKFSYNGTQANFARNSKTVCDFLIKFETCFVSQIADASKYLRKPVITFSL